MADSISKAQASALADGFFDNVGSTKGGLQPEETLAALIRSAGFLAGQAITNLNKSDRVATGALSDSIKVLDPRVVNGVNVIVDVEALFYYQFVDGGVKGTKRGAGKFSFKNDKPGRTMVNALRKWIIREGLKAKTKTGGKPITGRERFRKSITETSNSVAYAIARSIKQKGLKRTNFFDKAVRSTESKISEELSKGFKIDIINAIPNNLGDNNTK